MGPDLCRGAGMMVCADAVPARTPHVRGVKGGGPIEEGFAWESAYERRGSFPLTCRQQGFNNTKPGLNRDTGENQAHFRPFIVLITCTRVCDTNVRCKRAQYLSALLRLMEYISHACLRVTTHMWP